MGKTEERLKTNVIAIEAQLEILIKEDSDLLGEIQEADDFIEYYDKNIFKAKYADKAKLVDEKDEFISNREYLVGKLIENRENINDAQIKYEEAITELYEYDDTKKNIQMRRRMVGNKKKVVKRKVIATKPVASKPTKPTKRLTKPTKPTKPTARKPTKPIARKPTIVRRK
jgi:hypothetical protein